VLTGSKPDISKGFNDFDPEQFDMKLESPKFEDGGLMEEKYSCVKENVNPPLKINEIPEDAESLALIFDDPDAQDLADKIWLHWTVWNISPETTEISEGETPEEAVEGTTDFKETGYNGPNPPDGEHTAYFRLYALDTELDLQEGASRDELENAMEDHVIEKAEISCRFERV
jgi:Raf kinase inhibitor-like YbhB/YbcL family protein